MASTGSVEASQFWSAVSHLPSSSTPDPSNLTTDETADAQLKSEEFVKEMALKRKWRLSSSPLLLEELRAAARVFEGYHNFHNFTVQKEFHDRSAMRTMKKLTVCFFLLPVGTIFNRLTYSLKNFFRYLNHF